MKKSLKIDKFSNERFTNKEMNKVKGGLVCLCSCYYANSGGSSIERNGGENKATGAYSKKISDQLYQF